MASPVGHALIGASVFWLFPRERARADGYNLLACVALANLPDVDYVPGLLSGDLNAFHHSATHSLAFSALCVGLGWMVGPWFRMGRRQAGWLFGCLVLSHLLMDIMTADLRPPIGIPLLWPVSSRAVTSPYSLFLPPQKASLSELVCLWNACVVGMEILITGPLAAWIWLRRCRRRAP